jgi:hypothetical protein
MSVKSINKIGQNKLKTSYLGFFLLECLFSSADEEKTVLLHIIFSVAAAVEEVVEEEEEEEEVEEEEVEEELVGLSGRLSQLEPSEELHCCPSSDSSEPVDLEAEDDSVVEVEGGAEGRPRC